MRVCIALAILTAEDQGNKKRKNEEEQQPGAGGREDNGSWREVTRSVTSTAETGQRGKFGNAQRDSAISRQQKGQTEPGRKRFLMRDRAAFARDSARLRLPSLLQL